MAAAENYTMKSKPKQGAWIPLPKKMFVECCDCGLVHEIDVRVKSTKPYLEWRATQKERKEN